MVYPYWFDHEDETFSLEGEGGWQVGGGHNRPMSGIDTFKRWTIQPEWIESEWELAACGGFG